MTRTLTSHLKKMLASHSKAAILRSHKQRKAAMSNTAYYVVSTDSNCYRLTNNGQMWCGNVRPGKGPKDVKEFKRLGWAKKAAERAQNDNPWMNLVVIGLEADERLLVDGSVARFNNGVWQETGRGRIVAQVVKSNLQTALFG